MELRLETLADSRQAMNDWLKLTSTSEILFCFVLLRQRVDKIFRMMDRDKNAQRKYSAPAESGTPLVQPARFILGTSGAVHEHRKEKCESSSTESMKYVAVLL